MENAIVNIQEWCLWWKGGNLRYSRALLLLYMCMCVCVCVCVCVHVMIDQVANCYLHVLGFPDGRGEGRLEGGGKVEVAKQT